MRILFIALAAMLLTACGSDQPGWHTDFKADSEHIINIYQTALKEDRLLTSEETKDIVAFEMTYEPRMLKEHNLPSGSLNKKHEQVIMGLNALDEWYDPDEPDKSQQYIQDARKAQDEL